MRIEELDRPAHGDSEIVTDIMVVIFINIEFIRNSHLLEFAG